MAATLTCRCLPAGWFLSEKKNILQWYMVRSFLPQNYLLFLQKHYVHHRVLTGNCRTSIFYIVCFSTTLYVTCLFIRTSTLNIVCISAPSTSCILPPEQTHATAITVTLTWKHACSSVIYHCWKVYTLRQNSLAPADPSLSLRGQVHH